MYFVRSPMFQNSKEYIHYNVKISDADDDDEEPSEFLC